MNVTDFEYYNCFIIRNSRLMLTHTIVKLCYSKINDARLYVKKKQNKTISVVCLHEQ